MSLITELATALEAVDATEDKKDVRVFVAELLAAKIADKQTAALIKDILFKDSTVNWRGVISRIQKEMPQDKQLVLDAGLNTQ